MDINTTIKSALFGSDKVPLSKFTNAVVIALAVPLAVFQVWLALLFSVPKITLGVAFMVPLFVIALLTTTGVTGQTKLKPWDYFLAGATALSGIYLLTQSNRLASWILGLYEFTYLDVLAGTVLFFVTIILMKRCIGLGITIVVLLLVSYVVFGHLFNGALWHRHFEYSEIVEQSIISINGGFFGAPISAVATYVYLFVVFGKLLEVSGGGQFFFNLAALFTGRRPGGVAKVAVVSSGMFGMISGSPTADIMTTGSVTMPMMKKSGYSARMAAAIETVASIGGSLLPPVMGAVVFILVEYTGIAYSEVIRSSIIIALLYYFAVYIQVHFFSVRHDIGYVPKEYMVRFQQVVKTGWPFVLPIGVLVYMIEAGWTPQRSVTFAIALTIVFSWFNKNPAHRIDGKRLLSAVVQATVMMAPLVAAVAGAGLVELSLNVTGLASKISQQLFLLSNGVPVLVLIVAALVTIIFGMGMPTPAVYALSAVLLAPALVQAGYGLLPAHMFLVWFAIASHITPPVAVAAYVASTIADAEPAKVANTCVKLGFLAFLLPFVFVHRTGLMLDGDMFTILMDVIITAASVYLIAGAFAGYVLAPLSIIGRWVVSIFAMLALFSWTIPALSLGAGIIGFGYIIVNWRMRRRS